MKSFETRALESIHEVTVLVDMDGVLADFETPNNDIMRTHFPGIAPVLDRAEFYYVDSYQAHEGVREKIYQENRRPGFFTSFPIVDGALQGWQRILDAGFIPRVCSSPLEAHDTVIVEKQAWLEEHFVPRFGIWVVDTAIFDRDKSSYDAIAMIDDRPTLRNRERASWQHIVFSQSYNASVETDFRLDSWHDARLEELLRRTKTAYMLNRMPLEGDSIT